MRTSGVFSGSSVAGFPPRTRHDGSLRGRATPTGPTRTSRSWTDTTTATAGPTRGLDAGRVGGSTPGFLAAEAIGFYAERGDLVVENAPDAGEARAVLNEATAVCRGERGHFDGSVGPHAGPSDEEVLKRCLCIHSPHRDAGSGLVSAHAGGASAAARAPRAAPPQRARAPGSR